MKNMIKLGLFIFGIMMIYQTRFSLVEILLPQNGLSANTSLLLMYGTMIGFSLLIVFLMILQSSNMEKVMKIKPRISKFIFRIYLLIGITLIILTLIDYKIQTAIIMSIVFMLATSILDMIREKILQSVEGNILHPKRII